jgi:RNA polymerase sigma factor (sigma-70 family)
MRLVREKDPSAHDFLQRYSGKLRGHLLQRYNRLLGGFVGVEDIVQDTLVKAIENVASYQQQKGELGQWLFTIGRNTAINWVKKHQRDLNRLPAVAARARQRPQEYSALKARIHRAIEQAPSELWQIILRKDLEAGGLESAAVLAKELQIAVQTVLNNRNQARKYMASELEDLR